MKVRHLFHYVLVISFILASIFIISQGNFAFAASTATLHVIKHVMNDDGRIATSSSFNIHVKKGGVEAGGSPASGEESPGRTYGPIPIGIYNISEDTVGGYNFSFSGDCNASGNVTLANGNDKTCTITNDDTPIQPASALSFSVQPLTTLVGETISPSIEVQVQDSNGVLIFDATNTITLTLQCSGSCPTLGGTPTKSAVSGVATFNDLSISVVGMYTLLASSAGLNATTSISFNIFSDPCAPEDVITNNEKLSLPTNTAIGTKVKVCDGFVITNDIAGDNGFYFQNGTSNSRPIYTPSIDHGGGDISWNGSAWQNTNGIFTFDNVLYPWLGADSGSDHSGYVMTHPAIEQLISPSTDLTAVFVSGAGTAEVNGIYTDRGDSGAGKHSFTLLGTGDNSPVNTILWDVDAFTPPRWAIRGSDGIAAYSSTEDVEFPWQVTTWTHDGIDVNENPDEGVDPVPTTTSITQGELDAGVTVTGAGEPTANGVRSSGATFASARNVYDSFDPPADGVLIYSQGSTRWFLSDTAYLGQYISITGSAFPWDQVYEYDSGFPLPLPVPTVTRNDIAAEANWQIISSTSSASVAFSVEPLNTVSGSVISPSVEVEVLDFNGDLVSDATSSITLSIGNNPGGGTLSGTITKSAINGAATFDNLSINNIGSSYTLVASAPTLDSATSTSFNISSASGGSSGGAAPLTGISGGGSYIPPSDISTSSTPTVGCLPGDLYSRMNGEVCVNVVIPSGCEGGNLYSTLSGKKCPVILNIPPLSINLALFRRDLTFGDIGEDVRNLQLFLNSEGFTVASSGPGSSGNETTYFGFLTQSALSRFQAAKGIKPSVGYFGPITRRFIKASLLP